MVSTIGFSIWVRLTHRIHFARSVWEYEKDEDAILRWTTIYAWWWGNNVKTKKFSSFDWVIYKLLLFFLWVFILILQDHRLYGFCFSAMARGSILATTSQNDFMHSMWAFRLSAVYITENYKRFLLRLFIVYFIRRLAFILFSNKWIQKKIVMNLIVECFMFRFVWETGEAKYFVWVTVLLCFDVPYISFEAEEIIIMKHCPCGVKLNQMWNVFSQSPFFSLFNFRIVHNDQLR